MNKVGTAYVLWLGGMVGLSGLHRLYNGKVWTGLLWLLTFGFFGLGQLVDLLLIPQMVEAHNVKLSSRLNAITSGITPNEIGIHRVVEPLSLQAYRSQAIVDLLKAAEARGGKLSVTQGVIATGLSFFQVEEMLQEMLRTGYVEISNDPETGVVVYDFKEM
ncbi:MAG: NINE protein [Phormidesmis sp. CAN_BIN44]|nr:NINE protein [Phormidesmis sp. CAN_BIN44]